MVCCLLDDVLALEKLVGNQPTKVSDNVHHGVVDGVCRVIADIHKINFLNPVTSRNRCTSLMCVICMLEFAWAVVLSGMMSGPG